MVVYKVTGIRIYTHVKFRKPEPDTIKNDKATLEQRYTHTANPEYGNEDKGIAGLQGD